MVSGLNISRLSGEQASIELRGDIVYVGASSDTTFRIDSSSDVSAIEKTTGYATTVAGAPTANQTLNLTSVDLTITKSSTGTRTVAPGTSVDLYNAMITSDATFDVSNYTFALTTGSANNGFSSFSDNKVTIYINGIDYEIVATTNATATRTFSATADRFRVEPGVPVKIRVVANVRSNASPVPADYVGTFSIAQVKNVSNGNTSTITKSQAGDKITVKNGTAVLKNATIAPISARTVYSSADIEIGRFGVGAEAENITVRKLTLTNAASMSGVTDWTTIISSNSVKLVDVATNSQISATVTVNNSGTIIFDSMSAEVIKDTTRNFKVVATTSGFSNVEHGKRIDLSVTLNTVDKASGSAATVTPGPLASVSTTDYVVGVIPPTVSISKKSAKVFLVKVTNVSSESDITLDALKIRVKPVAVNNSTYTAIYCLRSEGSSASTCPEATTSTSTGSVPGVAANLVINAPQVPTISKNGSTYSYEILVDSNFVDPTDLLGEVLALTYNGTITEEYSSVTAQ